MKTLLTSLILLGFLALNTGCSTVKATEVAPTTTGISSAVTEVSIDTTIEYPYTLENGVTVGKQGIATVKWTVNPPYWPHQVEQSPDLREWKVDQMLYPVSSDGYGNFQAQFPILISPKDNSSNKQFFRVRTDD